MKIKVQFTLDELYTIWRALESTKTYISLSITETANLLSLLEEVNAILTEAKQMKDKLEKWENR